MTTLTEPQQQVQRWLTFCSGLLASTPQNYMRLKRSLLTLSNWADGVYPEFEEGREVSFLDYERLDLNDEEARQFTDLTGDILFNGIDGPRQTGRVLERALEQLVAEIARGHAPVEWRNDG